MIDIECGEDDNECDDVNENEFENGYDDESDGVGHDDDTRAAGTNTNHLPLLPHPIPNQSKPIAYSHPSLYTHSHHIHSLYSHHIHHYHYHHFNHVNIRHHYIVLIHVHLRHDYLL